MAILLPIRNPYKDMQTLNELAHKHYTWLQQMGYNNTTYLEAAGMIFSEVGESVNESDPLDLVKLEVELADIILRSMGLAKRFHINIDEAIKSKTLDWKKWSIEKRWNNRNNLEALVFITAQGVPVINKCRKDTPSPDVVHDIAMVILSTLSLATKNGLKMHCAISAKIEENIATGNKGRVK